jgi:hypothetical protein
MADEAPYDPPRYAFLEPSLRSRRVRFPAQLIALPLLDLVENQLDRAHLAFIHPGTFGADQDPLVARQRVVLDADGRGLRVEDDGTSPWAAAPKVPGGRFARALGVAPPVASYSRFELGGTVYAYVEYPDGRYDVVVTFLTPADESHTWLFFETIRTRAPHLIGDVAQRFLMRKVFEEGLRETSLILSDSIGEGSRAVSVESDRAGLAARRLIHDWGARSPTGAQGR